MSFDHDDDLERIVRPFYEISKKGLIEGAAMKFVYNVHTNREQYMLDRAVRRLRMRQELMREYVATARERTDSMRSLLDVKKDQLQLQADYRNLLENGPDTPQLPDTRPSPPQATASPMSAQITQAQIQQDIVTISLGLGNIPEKDEQCDFLIEQEDRLVNEGYSPELANNTIQKAVKVFMKR